MESLRGATGGHLLRPPMGTPIIRLCVPNIKIVDFLTISQEINLARILTISQNLK